MAVSLPSIHEMFPEHLLRLPPPMRHPPPTLIISQARHSPPSNREPQYSFNVLRSEPASVSLEHITSSVSLLYQLQSPRRRDSRALSSNEDDDEKGDGKHVCQTCNKSFNRPSSLRIHVNTHTGATPFQCPFPSCGRKFNVNSNMRRHYRNHIYLRAVWVVQWPADAESNFTVFLGVPRTFAFWIRLTCLG
ncbi:uncharacterized protein ARMOST_20723 [Armillaria ostoyae]|uniref:C2H2-type domain-containing protein n=1 Tax=Armillaria ostoyae TaxID=47428 RepID=A0A284S860_ARMOS|nr:uncharacterized protein ARMOST_20723 [Armillaria ostoyae]